MSARIIVLAFILLVKESHGVFFFRNYSSCADGTPLKFDLRFKTINNMYQVFEGDYIGNIVCGENLRASMKAQVLVGTMWTHLFTLNEKRGLCTLLDTYIGPLFHETLTAAGVLATCPIQKTKFQFKNYRPNFGKMKLQLPPGRMRARIDAHENNNNRLAICADVEVENKM